MIRSAARPAFWLPALILACCAIGCATPQTDLKVTSLGNHQTFHEPLTEAYCRHDAAGNVDVVLIDKATQQGLAGRRPDAPVRQIMHIRVLWMPSREMKAVATNASIKWYVIGDTPQDVLEYSGSGFVAIDEDGAITSVSIKNAMLHPSNNHGHLLDPVGPSSLEGTIAAKSDESAVRQVLDDLHSTTAAASDAGAMP